MRLPSWIFSIWIAVVTIRYCSTVIRSLRFPFNAGADLEWAAGWIGASLLLLLSFALVRPRVAVWAWTVLCVATAAAMLILSGALPAFVAALWALAACAAAGQALLRRMLPENGAVLDKFVCALPVGFALLSIAIFVLASLQMLRPLYIWTLLALCTIPLVFAARNVRSGAAAAKEISREQGLLIVLMGFSTVANLAWAIAPEVQFDALNYHLFVPREYLRHSGFVEIPFMHAYYARLIEYFLTICLAAGGAGAAKLWMFFLSVGAAVSTFALGRSLFDARVGLWAAAFFYTTPVVGWVAGTVYVENALALFVTAAFLAVVRWKQTRHAGWYYAACLIAGAAAGSKVIAVFAFAVPALAMIAKPRTLAAGALLFLMVALPSYALTYAYTGNPVFPLFNGVFQSPKWDADNTISNAADFGIGHSLSSLVRFPFRMTFDTSRFSEYSRGTLGLSLLLAFPFAGWLAFRGRPASYFVATFLVYLILLFYTMQYARYYIPILPLVSTLGVATAFHFAAGRAARVIAVSLWIALLVQPVLLPLQMWSISERFPLFVAAGLESREAFLERALGGYRLAKYLNSAVPSSQTILGVGTEHLRFYLDSPLETLGISLLGSGSRQLAGLAPDAGLAAEMKKHGFGRLLVMRSALKDPPPWYPYLDASFLEEYAVREVEDESAILFRMRE